MHVHVYVHVSMNIHMYTCTVHRPLSGMDLPFLLSSNLLFYYLSKDCPSCGQFLKLVQHVYELKRDVAVLKTRVGRLEEGGLPGENGVCVYREGWRKGGRGRELGREGGSVYEPDDCA